MSDRKIKIELTVRQSRLIFWALCGGKDQFEKHLMHDEWDEEAPRAVVKDTLQTHKQFCRAIKLFADKVRASR